MKIKSSLLIAFFCFLFLFSCDKKRVFDEYKNVGNSWHKDSIVTFELPQLDSKKKYDFYLAMGDDVTDEHLFQALPEKAFTIKLGPDESNAKYRIKSVKDTLKLLKDLSTN